MNFTTLIMLIFTAILAIGLVSKGLIVVFATQKVYVTRINYWVRSLFKPKIWINIISVPNQISMVTKGVSYLCKL